MISERGVERGADFSEANLWGIKTLKSLEAWKKARGLKQEIAILAKTFPAEERYRLADQLIRSSRSVCTQIAEGHGRKTGPDKLRFCVIARGSLSETLNHLIDALDEAYIKEEQLNYFRNIITETEKVLNGYIKFLEQSANR